MNIDPSGRGWFDVALGFLVVAVVAVAVVVAAPVVVPALVTTAGITLSTTAVVATASVVAEVSLLTAGACTVAGAAEETVTYFAEHRKVKKAKWDKHTKPRAGRKTTKNRLKDDWKDMSGKRRSLFFKYERDENRWF